MNMIHIGLDIENLSKSPFFLCIVETSTWNHSAPFIVDIPFLPCSHQGLGQTLILNATALHAALLGPMDVSTFLKTFKGSKFYK